MSNYSLNNNRFVRWWCDHPMSHVKFSHLHVTVAQPVESPESKLPRASVLLCTKMWSFKLAPIFQLPIRTAAACFTHSPYKLPPFQVKVQISALPASPGGCVSQEHFGRANMSDSKCVCSASCCKIIISSRTVLNYKHVLTVWSVNVNWGKKRRS